MSDAHQQKRQEMAFFAAVAQLAEATLSSHEGLVIVLASAQAISVQGAGNVEGKELSNALRRYADELDKQGAQARRIILAGDPRFTVRGKA